MGGGWGGEGGRKAHACMRCMAVYHRARPHPHLHRIRLLDEDGANAPLRPGIGRHKRQNPPYALPRLPRPASYAHLLVAFVPIAQKDEIAVPSHVAPLHQRTVPLLGQVVGKARQAAARSGARRRQEAHGHLGTESRVRAVEVLLVQGTHCRLDHLWVAGSARKRVSSRGAVRAAPMMTGAPPTSRGCSAGEGRAVARAAHCASVGPDATLVIRACAVERALPGSKRSNADLGRWHRAHTGNQACRSNKNTSGHMCSFLHRSRSVEPAACEQF